MTSFKPKTLTLALTLVSFAAAAVVGAAGCSGPTPRQTEIVEVPSSEAATAALTPIQRGEVRRDVLRVARAGMEAWKKGDVKGIRSTFATDMADYYAKNLADYAKAGQVRVRKYRDIEGLEVIDMDAQGNQALANWKFYDESYVADKSGKALTKPTGKETSLQFTLDKKDGEWRISRIIGAQAVLK